MSSKETRYRFLLGLYPAEFRREYADEMIGVLMADPRPVRRHATSLMAGAGAARLRAVLDGPEWRRAAFVVQVFGAILLFAVALRRFEMGGGTAILLHPQHVRPPIDAYDTVRLAAWTIVLAATVAGVRGVAVAAALAGVVAECTAASRHYYESPVVFLGAFWIVMAGAVVLIVSEVAARGPRPRGWPFVTLGALALVSNGFVTGAFPGYVGALTLFRSYGGYGTGVSAALVLAAVALTLVGVARIEPAVRRRVIACVVPVAAVFPLVGYGFGGLIDFNLRHPEDIRVLGPVQWAALVVVPALAFRVAAGLNRRLERSRAAVAAAPTPDV